MDLDFPSSSKRRRISVVEDGNSNSYDVFISFRGIDTRTNFTSHVCAALSKKHIKAFVDSKDLRAGNEISGSLLKAIEESQLCLVIISPNYGSSRWCLIELEYILLCSRQHGKKVIPVFYQVDPSDIRNQTGSLGIAFASKHEGREETEQVIKWRAALKEAANLSGLHLNDNKPEPEFIDEIVAAILRELKPMLPLSNISKNLVGINHHVENIQRLLCMNSEVVCRVGIWGMGGIGKTTIAKSVFARIGRQFDGYYFFEDIRGEIARHGKGFFWSKFCSEGLIGKKVFIVYDGVDDLTFLHIQELAELNHLLAGGSKILMTSRDSHVLKKLNVDEVYEVVGLSEEESLKLFSFMAFKNEFPPSRFWELCTRVVHSTRGNPLALRALGSHFIGRDDENYWHSELEKIEGVYKKPIIELLRISYDALSPIEKEVFLDIVFFFKGEVIDHVDSLLNSIYDSVYSSSVIHLIEKCFISISQRRKIEIHDLIQQMGLEIANEDANRGECKRLCNSKEIYRLLIEKKGIETIQGISLNLSEGKNMSIEVDVFSKMVNLRWLKVYGRNDDEDVRISDTQRMIQFQWMMKLFKKNKEVLPLPHLKYLCWEEFPLKSLPWMFNAQSLVKLSLPESKIERLWTGIQDVVNLKVMDLRESQYLIEIPDISKAKNMEYIILQGCCSLIRLHPCVQHLQKLKELNLSRCFNLSEIPSKFESKVLVRFSLMSCCRIRELPQVCCDKLERLALTKSDTQEIPDLREFVNLEVLFIFDCPCITKFPEMPNNLVLLVVLETGIEEVPSSLTEHLQILFLSSNGKLTSISSSISNLEFLTQLYIVDCALLSSTPELPPSLQILHVQDCPSMEKISIPTNSNCCHLQVVSCPELDEKSSSDIKKQFFEKLKLGMDMMTCIEGTEIPEEFRPPETIKDALIMCDEGSSVTLQLSLQLNGNYSFTSFAVWAALECQPRNLSRQEQAPLDVTLRIRVHSQLDDDQAELMETPLLGDRWLAFLKKTPPPQLVMRSFGMDSYPCQQIREILSGKYGFNPKISFQFLPWDPSYVVTRCGIYVAGIQGAEFMSPTFLITQ